MTVQLAARNQMRLLNDEQMQTFIRDGYVILHPDVRDGFHQEVFDLLEQRQARGMVGNNLVPSVPHLRHLFAHPDVTGALHSVLGPNYALHPHRHNHRAAAGQDAQNLHKDSLYNSRYCIDDRRRHHHTRWAMLLYYPQDTPAELGPTVVLPRSQYASRGQDALPLEGPAGTVVLIHYDIIHGRAICEPGDGIRHMLKFLFTRIEEPTSPSWNHSGTPWAASADVQEPVWEHMWHWHLGRDPQPGRGGFTDRLHGADFTGAVSAAYDLAVHGVDALAAALTDERVELRTAAAYGLAASGRAAGPVLLPLLRSADPGIRARAADVLGDLGRFAADATGDLATVLGDADPVVRRHAVEALGTTAATLPYGIADLLGDEDAHVRREAALALARLAPHTAGDPSVVPALERALDDPSHYVRGYAIEALGRIGSTEATTAALDYLRTTRWDPALTAG